MIWCQFKLEHSIKLFFRDNQVIQNHVHMQTLNDLGGKASALRAQGKYSEDLSSQGMHHKVNLFWPTILHISTKATTHSQLSMEMDDMVSVQASTRHQAISSRQSSDPKSCSSADPQRSWW